MAKKSAKKGAVITKTPDARVKDFALLGKPVITEKSSIIGSTSNTVVVRVDPRADKSQIKEAVERIFKVKVIGVRTSTFLGKIKRTQKSIGRKPGYKKAYIEIAEGQKVDLVEGI